MWVVNLIARMVSFQHGYSRTGKSFFSSLKYCIYCRSNDACDCLNEEQLFFHSLDILHDQFVVENVSNKFFLHIFHCFYACISRKDVDDLNEKELSKLSGTYVRW